MKGTKSNYKSAVYGPHGYATMCTKYRIQPFPAQSTKLVLWLQDVAGVLSHNAITSYLSGIGYYATRKHHQSETAWLKVRANPWVQDVLTGIATTHGTNGPQLKEALTAEKLKCIKPYVNMKHHNSRLWWAVATSGLAIGHVAENSSNVQVHARAVDDVQQIGLGQWCNRSTRQRP